MATSTAQLYELLAPTIESMGFELWGIQYSAHKGSSLLRVYIESEAGISVDDCAAVSRQLSHLLDVEDPIHVEYRLEISSPGMERPFFTLDQYARFIGHVVKLKLRFPFEGRRQYKGQLTGIENDELVLVDGEHEYCLPFEGIEKGHLVPQFD